MDNSEMLPGSVEGGGPSAISVMVTTISTPTTLSTRESLSTMESMRRRSSPVKLVSLGGLERQNYCCGHWFPSAKSYHRHLAEKASSDLTHEMKLIELGMIRCTHCAMWVHVDSMGGHVRKVHGIVKVTKAPKVLATSATATGKEVMGISGETLKSGTNFVIKVSGQAGTRNANGNVSAVANSSGLKLVTTSSGSLYQKVQLQQTVNTGSGKVLIQKSGTPNSIPLVSLGPRIVMKSAVKTVSSNKSVPISSGSKIIPLQGSGQVIQTARTIGGVTTVQLAGATMLASNSGTSQNSPVPTSFVQSKKSASLNGQNISRLIKKCATIKKKQPLENQTLDNVLEESSNSKDRPKVSSDGLKSAQSKKSRKQVLQPNVEPETSLLADSPSASLNLKIKKKKKKLQEDGEVLMDDKIRSPKPSMNHKGYRRKLKENPSGENSTPRSSRQNPKGARGGMKKKRGPGRPRKERVVETPDLSEIDSLFGEMDKEDAENEPLLMTKEEENVPTVELDLFTLPSLNEQVSVLLTEPQNPNFKVYASMDAIFVGDSALGDVTNQIGYVTDANNVVYVNPGHFLFPNVEDLENFVPSPIVTMKGNKMGVNPNKVSKLSPSKPVAPAVLRENWFVNTNNPKDTPSSSDVNAEKVCLSERESQGPSVKGKEPASSVKENSVSEFDTSSVLHSKSPRITKADTVQVEQTNPDILALETTSESSVSGVVYDSSAFGEVNSRALASNNSKYIKTQIGAHTSMEKRETPSVSKIAQSEGQSLFLACKNDIEMPVNICEGDVEGEEQSQDSFAVDDVLSSDFAESIQEKPSFTSETAKLLLSIGSLPSSTDRKQVGDQILEETAETEDPESKVNSEEQHTVPEEKEEGTTSEISPARPQGKQEDSVDSKPKQHDTVPSTVVERVAVKETNRKTTAAVSRRSRTKSVDVALGISKSSSPSSRPHEPGSLVKPPKSRTRSRQTSDSALINNTHKSAQVLNKSKEHNKESLEVGKDLSVLGEMEKTVFESACDRTSLLSPDRSVVAQSHVESPVLGCGSASSDSKTYPLTPNNSEVAEMSDQTITRTESLPQLPEVEHQTAAASVKTPSLDKDRKRAGRPRKRRRGKVEPIEVNVLIKDFEPAVSPLSPRSEKSNVTESVAVPRPIRERRPSSKLIDSLSNESTKKKSSPKAALGNPSTESDEQRDQEQPNTRISCVPLENLQKDSVDEMLDKDYVSPVRSADLSPSREWHGRGAKLKAQVLIQDQQSGVIDSQILPSSLDISPSSKVSPGQASQGMALKPLHLDPEASPPKTPHISKSPISPRNLKSPRSPSYDDREWQARRAKLKAQVMISDQQSGVSDSIVDSSASECVAAEMVSPPLKKLKIESSPGTRDIRCFFSVSKSPEYKPEEQSYTSSSPSPLKIKIRKKKIHRYEKADIRSFFTVENLSKEKLMSPPLQAHKTVRIKSPKKSPRKKDVKAVKQLQRTIEQLERSASNFVPPGLPIGLHTFEGFERCSRQSGLRAKSLQRLVSLLDMKRWYHLGRFPLPVDHLCDWNEDLLNSNIFD